METGKCILLDKIGSVFYLKHCVTVTNPVFYLDDNEVIRWHKGAIKNIVSYQVTVEKLLYQKGYRTDREMVQFMFDNVGCKVPRWMANDLQRCFERYQLRKQEEKDWEKMKETFDGNVLKIGRVEFRTVLDFTVRLSLLSGGYKRQIEYVKNNSQNIIDYVCAEIQKRQRVMNRIGSLNFYYVSQITVTRQSEVELMFSLKPKLEQLQ